MKTLLAVITSVALCLTVSAASKSPAKPALEASGSAPVSATANDAENTLNSPLQLFLGTVRTRADQQGISLAVDYGKKLADEANRAFTRRSVNISGKHPVFFKMTPDFHLNTGDKDAFEGLVAKVKANWVILPPFKTINVPGAKDPVIMPDPDGWFQVVTVAGGVETDGSFETINGIVEVGWEPEVIPRIGGWQIYGGIYAQGGYKFARNTKAINNTVGGETPGDNDQSKEREDDVLGRLKATVDIKSPEWNIGIMDTKFRLIAGTTVWYDFVNSEMYHSVKGVARFSLSKKQHFDLKYEHGSGAPNFNRGDQVSAGLTVEF